MSHLSAESDLKASAQLHQQGSERRDERPTDRIVVLILIVLFSLAIFWFGIARGWRHLDSDFPNYYTAAKMLRSGARFDRVYEWTWFQRQAIRAGVVEQPLVGFVPQPPLVSIPVLPLTRLSPIAAKRGWIVVNIALLAGCVWLLIETTGLRLHWALLVVCSCGGPLSANFRLGQYYVLLLFLLLWAYREYLRGRNIRCGALLAIAGALKVFPFGFALVLIVRRQWRALASLIVAGATLGFTSILLFGKEVHYVLFQQVLPRAARGELLAPYALGSFPGLWRRIFLFQPQLNPHPFFRSSLLCALLIAITAVAAFAALIFVISRRHISNALAWAGCAVWLSMMSALAVSYHYTVLIMPVAIVAGYLQRSGRSRDAALLMTCFAVICSVRTNNLVLWAGTFVLFLFLVAQARLELPPRRSIVFATVIASLVIVVITASEARRLRELQQDYSHQFGVGVEGIRASAPSMSGPALTYLQMFDGGYRVVSVADHRVLHYSGDNGKVIAFTSSNASRDVYVEVAGARSGIYRASGESSVQQWIADGLQPAMSQNAKWLAYVSRDGSGVIRRNLETGAQQKVLEGQDVLEMTISNAGQIFAAVGPISRARIITSERLNGSEIDSPVRFPSISPSGTRIAYGRREGEYWHLFIRDLISGRELRLVSLPCNTVEPFWSSEQEVLYASDCGRGLNLSTLARLRVPEL